MMQIYQSIMGNRRKLKNLQTEEVYNLLGSLRWDGGGVCELPVALEWHGT
jgi:hypothetical protein